MIRRLEARFGTSQRRTRTDTDVRPRVLAQAAIEYSRLQSIEIQKAHYDLFNLTPITGLIFDTALSGAAFDHFYGSEGVRQSNQLDPGEFHRAEAHFAGQQQGIRETILEHYGQSENQDAYRALVEVQAKARAHAQTLVQLANSRAPRLLKEAIKMFAREIQQSLPDAIRLPDAQGDQ